VIYKALDCGRYGVLGSNPVRDLEVCPRFPEVPFDSVHTGQLISQHMRPTYSDQIA